MSATRPTSSGQQDPPPIDAKEAQPTPVPLPYQSDGTVSLGKLLSWHLTARRYADGTPRDVSTITLFWEHGRWKVCLNDRDNGKVAFLTTSELTHLWDELEAALQARTLDWRKTRKS